MLQCNQQTLLRRDKPEVTPVEIGKTSYFTVRGAVCEAGIDLACVSENYQCEWYILSCCTCGTHKRLNILLDEKKTTPILVLEDDFTSGIMFEICNRFI